MRKIEIKMSFPFDLDYAQETAIRSWLFDLSMQALAVGAEVEILIDGEENIGGIN